MKTKVNLRNEKTANVVKSSNNENKVSFASVLDTLILNVKHDTTLQSIAENCEVLKKQYKNNIKYTASVIKAHIRYRIITQKQKLYLSSHNLTLNEKNMMLVVKKSKAVTETVTETVTE